MAMHKQLSHSAVSSVNGTATQNATDVARTKEAERNLFQFGRSRKEGNQFATNTLDNLPNTQTRSIINPLEVEHSPFNT